MNKIIDKLKNYKIKYLEINNFIKDNKYNTCNTKNIF